MAAFVVLEEDWASIVQLAALAEDLSSQEDKHEGEDKTDESPGLGRGLSRTRTKVGYIRQKERGGWEYMEAIEHFNTHMFSSLTGSKASEFESLLRQVVKFIISPIDPKLSRSDEEENLRAPREKALLPHTTLLFPVRVTWG